MNAQGHASHSQTLMANRRVFDGSRVVAHLVQAGENLTTIARIYQMPKWEPIWLYNTKVESILGPNPDEVRKGITILIPRSKAGYEKLVRKLVALSEAVVIDGEKLIYQLEGQYDELRARMVVINFAGDVLTIGATLALKFAKVAKLASVARASKGQAKIAVRIATNAEGQKLATQIANVRTRLVKTALHDHQALRTAKAGTTDYIRGKAVDAVTGYADYQTQTMIGNEDVTPFKDTKNAIALGGIGRRAITRGFSFQALGEVAEVLLDYTDPSKLAETALKWTTGENASGSKDHMIDYIKKFSEANARTLLEKAEKYSAESKLLYG